MVRNITDTQALSERLNYVEKNGVPNYYGAQRFGDSRYDTRGGNLVLAEKMLNGEDIRNRNKRSMAISALRSWLFNEFVSRRIEDGLFDQALDGDIMLLAGSASYFCADSIDETIKQRILSRDIQLSAPLWGQGSLAAHGKALALEQSIANDHASITLTLEKLGLKQERRALRLFATSVIREIVDINQHYEVD
jgi:tRNA pseudouridine13 synthase